MSTTTTNFNFVKPESSDPLDIDEHWNNNLQSMDSQLHAGDHLKTNHGSLGYSASSWVFSSAASYVPITSTDFWFRQHFQGNFFLNALSDNDGDFQFMDASLYKVTIGAEVIALSPDPPEARIGLRFSQTVLGDIVPGLDIITPYNTFGSLEETIVTCSTTFRVYDPVDEPSQPYTFKTSDIFNIEGMWQSSNGCQGAFNKTWIQIEQVQYVGLQ